MALAEELPVYKASYDLVLAIFIRRNINIQLEKVSNCSYV